jgi:hypothetical protein
VIKPTSTSSEHLQSTPSSSCASAFWTWPQRAPHYRLPHHLQRLRCHQSKLSSSRARSPPAAFSLAAGYPGTLSPYQLTPRALAWTSTWSVTSYSIVSRARAIPVSRSEEGAATLSGMSGSSVCHVGGGSTGYSTGGCRRHG